MNDLAYLENEKNEEFISLHDKRIAFATDHGLSDLVQKIGYFRSHKLTKVQACEWMFNLNIRHSELIEHEIETFKSMVKDWINNGNPIDYTAFAKIVDTRFKELNELKSKPVALTPKEEIECEQLAEIYLGGVNS